MTFAFTPASTFTERAGLFVSLTGSTNSGKTFSALRLARGIAGPSGKIAVLDTEGGRTLHLKDDFRFDVNIMGAPFRPHLFSEAAAAAESAGFDVLVIDSFSMEWVGLGGVLDWQAAELQRMAGDDYRKQERMKMAAWIKPKGAHKAMVYSFLQRRIPIVFSIRGEESVKPGENPGEKPIKIFKSICNSQFPFEVTVSFRLDAERKGYLDLSDERTFKLEGAHRGFFKHGDRISEDHGRLLAEWAQGAVPSAPRGSQQSGAGPSPATALDPAEIDRLATLGNAAADRGMEAVNYFWNDRTDAEQIALKPKMKAIVARAKAVDAEAAADPELQGASA